MSQPPEYPPGGYPQGGHDQGGYGQDQGGYGQGGYGAPAPGYGPPPGGYGAPQGFGSPEGYGAPPGYGAPGGYGGPGGFGPPPPYGRPIPNYLWQSIVVTVLCCLPAGVVAIVFATKVDGRRQIGDINGAFAASKKARMWCIIAVLAGVASFIIFFILALAGGFDSSSSTSYSTFGPAEV